MANSKPVRSIPSWSATRMAVSHRSCDSTTRELPFECLMKCQPVSTLRRRDEDAGSAAPDRSGRSRHLKSLFRVSGMAGLFLLAGVATSVVPAFSDLQAGQHGAPAESKASTRGGVPVTRTAAVGDVGADMCRIPAPKGPWDYHLARDLPQGS